ncbi:MAG TPA: DUF6515 family protein [Steroidobacteraceae bacterium]|nr:DUF6515 family protein [Steroidobacteraceae bacterium]
MRPIALGLGERALRRALVLACVTAAIFVLAIGVASANPRQHEGPRPGFDHMDARFHHDHYYPSRGYAVHDLPRDRIVVNGPRGRYYFSGGVWYEARGPRFVVVSAPIGLFVPVLPPFYTTVWFAGVPYYYADDTYYAWRPSSGEYEVVDPPGGDPTTDAPPAPPSPNGDVFVYPKNGQSEEDQARDKYECHKWAQGQSGFDPTAANGGVPPEQANARRADYQRAIGACLEGRGYTVK